MSTATFPPLHGGRPPGATATSASPPRHRLGAFLRAVKVFAATTVRVVVFGEYSEDAGLIRR